MAAKSNEANALRQENQALLEENTRLSDLTRMLLSSPAFSTFLDTLGASELATTTAAGESVGRSAETSDSTSLPPTTNKDPNPHLAVEEQLQASQTQNPQVGLTLIPEHPIDFSTLDANPNNTWGLGNLPAGLWGNTQPQVFTVTDLPTGPPVDVIDAPALSGKSPDLLASACSLDEVKNEIPRVESMPVIGEPDQELDETAPAGVVGPDEPDSAFALFADAPVPSPGSAVPRPGSEWALQSVKRCEGVALEKEQDLPVTLVEQDHQQGDPEATRMEHFRRLCKGSEAAFERICRITSHLQRG